MRKKEEYSFFKDPASLEKARSFYLVGIGGYGMSAIATLLHQMGYSVRGSDLRISKTVESLQNFGIEVTLGHTAENILPEDTLIFSDAIWLANSPEFKRGCELKCPLFRRTQVLSWLLKGKRTIAITGTHGKTTTTALTALALKGAGLDPLVLVGGKVPEFGGSSILGKDSIAVVEACEAYDGHQDLDPDIVVLTNLEAEHLDFHESYESLKQSMIRFVNKIPQSGCLIYCGEDSGACEVAENFAGKKIQYSTKDFSRFSKIETLKLIGDYNRSNASAALAVANELNLDLKYAGEAIATFKGVERRQQIHYNEEVLVMDDYAHHQTAICNTITGLREAYPGRRIVYVFQPHMYSAVAQFKHEIANALSQADYVVLTDIFAAREEPIPGISSSLIVDLISKPVSYVPCRHLLPRVLKSISRPGDLIIGSGVGNISEMGPALADEFKRPSSLKVSVIYGGDSEEREVSILMGKKIFNALKKKGYAVDLVDISEKIFNGGDLSYFIGKNRPDAAFLAVPGVRGEDGSLQGFFEILHIPYTFSNVLTSAMAFDKKIAKSILGKNGLPVLPHKLFMDVPDSAQDLQAPLIVKPNAQGSTLGLTFVEHQDQILSAIKFALRYGSEVLVEPWIQGTELTVPILSGKALPVIEIVPSSGRYDFSAKYEVGGVEEIIPARIPKAVDQLASEYAEKAYHLFNCRGAARLDLIYDGQDLHILELNTVPGMTDTSLLTNSSLAAGISYEDLCDQIVQEALQRPCKKESLLKG